jgi:hypothetical protein
LNEREQTQQERPKPKMEDIMEMEKALAAVKRCQIVSAFSCYRKSALRTRFLGGEQE